LKGRGDVSTQIKKKRESVNGANWEEQNREGIAEKTCDKGGKGWRHYATVNDLVDIE